MSETKNGPDNYADLLWAINGTQMLALPKNKLESEILSLINEKIKNLRDSGCEGVQQKFRKFDQDNAITYLAELVVAEYFLNRGHGVTLLDSEYLPRESPDILITTQNGELFVEVTYMSSSDPAYILIDDIRKITDKYPYVINFSFATDVSLPHHERSERNQQILKLKQSVEQFDLVLQKIRVEALPFHGSTDSFSYEMIEVKNSGKGYPAILTSSCLTELNFSYKYLTFRLQIKGKKRLTFPKDKQKIPYIIALVCDERGINSGELGYLLYGSTKSESYLVSLRSIPEELKEEIKKRRWITTLKRLASQDSWSEIQKVKGEGWEELLLNTYLIPHDYCYIEEPGLYFTEPIMRQMSGVLFCRCTGICKIFPNQFSIDKMHYSPFWENL